MKIEEKSLTYVIGLLLISNIVNIAFFMTFSTLFESSKLAAYSYFMLILFAIVLYVTFIEKALSVEPVGISLWSYSLNWFLLFPAITLMKCERFDEINVTSILTMGSYKS